MVFDASDFRFGADRQTASAAKFSVVIKFDTEQTRCLIFLSAQQQTNRVISLLLINHQQNKALEKIEPRLKC